MKKLIQVCFLLCVASSAFAQSDQQTQAGDTPFPANAQTPQKVLRVYDWKDLMSQHPFPNCQIVSMDGMSVLKIVNTNSVPANYEFNDPYSSLSLPLDTNDTSLQISLLEITNQSLIKKTYSISFEMKFENVVDKWIPMKYGGRRTEPANLTLYNYVSPLVSGGDEITNGTGFFGSMVGTLNWKRYDIGVSRKDGLPNRLELKLFLPGHGTVFLRPLKLIDVTQNWWSPEQSGLIGGIGGSLIGCMGALIGILASMGKARRFVLTTTFILIVIGFFLVIAGIVAVAMKQPYAVWYPLMLGGAILTFVLSINFYSIKRRYEDQEIRRMTSMDVTGR